MRFPGNRDEDQYVVKVLLDGSHKEMALKRNTNAKETVEVYDVE